MPYVPAINRPELDKAAEQVAIDIASASAKNFDVLTRYKAEFLSIGGSVVELSRGASPANAHPLAQVIYAEAKQYRYDGAMLGLLNYSITRVIQRVPQLKVARKEWKDTDELRYWLYAVTVEALTFVHSRLVNNGFGVAGVFEDIKDEYKIRVNQSYEAAQIIKSGDCYDTPYYSKLMAVKGQTGNTIGHVHVMVNRSSGTQSNRVLDDALTATKTVEGLTVCPDGHVTVALPPATPESLVDMEPVKRKAGRPKKVVA